MGPLAALVIVSAAIIYLVSRLIVFRNAVRRDGEKEKNGRDSPDKVGR